MKKLEKTVYSLVLIYVIAVSIIMIYKVSQPPEYNQEIFDEVYAQYEKQKNEYVDELNNDDIKVEKKKNKPANMTINVAGNKYKVIGKIIIDKINVDYPIISKTSDENLKIAPTKLCGPIINTTGNLCIVGHNYLNGKLFSNLNKLNINDEIVLIDNNDISLLYKVYDKKTVSSDDLSVISQDTNGCTEVTLITCTNKNDKRLVVKCKSV